MQNLRKMKKDSKLLQLKVLIRINIIKNSTYVHYSNYTETQHSTVNLPNANYLFLRSTFNNRVYQTLTAFLHAKLFFSAVELLLLLLLLLFVSSHNSPKLAPRSFKQFSYL